MQLGKPVSFGCHWQKKGKLISEPDIWISAIYITKNLPLVTTNIRHFKRLKEYGLKILSVKFQTENNSIP